MFNLIIKLKKNYKLSALANTAKEWFDFKRQKFDLDKYFDVIVTSGYTNIAKPDSKIYEIILNKLNANAEDCLFIDDKEKYLSPAKSIGMKTILFTNQIKLERKLISVGIYF